MRRAAAGYPLSPAMLIYALRRRFVPVHCPGDLPMFIAMNRFRVKKGSEAEFDAAWLKREVYINREPGFVAFHLLRGPQYDDYSLYASHTIWASQEAFEAWTRSESFRAAHKNAGENKPLYLGGPQFEGFDVIQHVTQAGEQ